MIASAVLAGPALRRKKVPLRLEPGDGTTLVDGVLHADSLPAWLRLEPIEHIKRHAWVRLRYSSNMFDDPVRPLIRFISANGTSSTHPMNGAVLGTAEWIGRIPNNTASVLISPGRTLGPISFRIDRVDTMSRRELMRSGFLADPPWALWSVRSRLLNSREEAWQALKYARGGTVFDRYWEWHRRLARPLEFGAIDRPGADWNRTPHFHLFMSLGDSTVTDMLATLSSLRDQVYPRWSLHAVIDERTPPALLDAYRAHMREDERFSESTPQDRAAAPNVSKSDAIAAIGVGDTLQNYALGVMAEAFAKTPQAALLYSDEDAVAPNGVVHAPILKPDWSPIFNESVRYVGRLTCIRCENLLAAGADGFDLLFDEDATLGRVLADIDPDLVGHVRRILYRRSALPGDTSYPRVSARKSVSSETQWPRVSIIIPTRDHFDFLSACTRSLKEHTDYPTFDVVVVDNGSTQPEACALLARLRGEANYRVLERPIPFNYSQLCNDGVRETNAQVLIFLNNDIEFCDAGWLKAMVRWATQPKIGVVGAKLIFPNRRIQHAGVVLGMGGLSGHIYRRSALRERGYLYQLESIRETFANTAACIAIERTKFEKVGGFDAENLPVDLNDIDLCLRVAEHGFTNLWTPEAFMIHAQSGSRGIEKDPFHIYRKERTYFMHRWAEAIRDDRYFHPGLSLFSQRPSLA